MLPEKHRKYLDQCFQHLKHESYAMLALPQVIHEIMIVFTLHRK